MARYYITPQAEQDLDECAAYIAQDNLEAALRLYDSARLTYRNLAENPQMGSAYSSVNPALRKLRFFPLTDFPKYMVFYLPERDGVTIVRLLHGARNIRPLI